MYFDTVPDDPLPSFGTVGLTYGSAFEPEAANTGASTWADVLKLGINRVADYKIATVAPQNVQGRIAADGRIVPANYNRATTTTEQAGGPSLAGLLPLLLVGGLVALLVRG